MWSKSTSTTLPEGIAAALKQQAAFAWPNECVGFIVQTDLRWFVMPLPAQSGPQYVFVEPSTLLCAAEALDAAHVQVVAVYHSHPDGHACLSAADYQFSAWARTHFLLVRVDEGWHIQMFRWS
ncbi:Mov34/MPN/PAD-1 family protein [Alicyclobacillus suci]|uniref:Mov34/MPN/PAD-1 family protein n=1 Tax=Alicyclobacillus suci TaxID=2816080 RepID=UPI001A8FFF95|nr:Mov34/MPN/PAD-1 family protein [Alicyclobacillus suci]